MEYSKQKPDTIIFPLVDDVSRVLEKPVVTSKYFIGADEFELRPQRFRKQAKGAAAAYYHGNYMKTPTAFEKAPLDFDFGPASGYLSFRYFDYQLPGFEPKPGEAIPADANIWGVLIPCDARENMARALWIIRESREPSPGELQQRDLDEATKVLYEYFAAHFLVDEACMILESLKFALTGDACDLFLSGINQISSARRLLGIISHYRMWNQNVTWQLAHCGLIVNAMSVDTFRYNEQTTQTTVNKADIARAYSQLLTDLLMRDSGTERIYGLHKLVSADTFHFRQSHTNDNKFQNLENLTHRFPNGSRQQLPCIVW
jgi:hypothetical protein